MEDNQTNSTKTFRSGRGGNDGAAVHIIHRQKVVLKMEGREQPYAEQDVVSRVVQQDLPKLLETVFNEVVPTGKVVRINTLQLDLGIIERSQFEAVFKERLIAALKTDIISQSSSPNQGTVILDQEQSLVEAFTYFLEWGSLPWYQVKTNIADWEGEMLAHFSKNNWQQLQQWLKNTAPESTTIQRLTTQFSSTFLEKILPLDVVFPNEKWSSLYDGLQEVFSQSGKSQFQIHQVIWLSVTTVWQQGLQGFAALKEVVKFVAKQLQFSLNDLTVPDVQNPDRIRSEMLKQVITSLYDEEKNINRTESDTLNLENTLLEDSQPTESASQREKPFVDEKTDGSAAKGSSPQKVKAKTQTLDKVQFVNHCGLVLLHPFLEMYFTELELVKPKAFTNVAAHSRAVLLLHYLATGESVVPEFELGLQKLLCHFPEEETLPNQIELTEKEITESAQLLQTVVNYWPPLKNTSTDGLRQTYLQREGKLEPKEGGWLLTVEQKTVDILLNKLPWGFSTIRLPWMKEVLNVDWK